MSSLESNIGGDGLGIVSGGVIEDLGGSEGVPITATDNFGLIMTFRLMTTSTTILELVSGEEIELECSTHKTYEVGIGSL